MVFKSILHQLFSIEIFLIIFLFQLVDRMPRLNYLITSADPFEDIWYPLPSIKRLDLYKCDFQSIDNLIFHLPNLSIFSFSHIGLSVRNLSSILASLFTKIASLRLVSVNIRLYNNSDEKSFKKKIEQIMIYLQNMDQRLLSLTFNCNYNTKQFSLQYL
ncbi:hypothetical protein I4U23_012289 [Adineta vaga]|nr:hypothetical protein I4U23_012289 [Adineta vaga]